ncbi:DUF6759 domain-containing protein [Chryseobacterium sp.]|uniref:DUF6759 domain-containing protein n=1 Tax=Chryseobacterium sp. TaxID=1871047 RepID=UPI00289D0BC4|nr:DUF6759 domain-containing protein [Chryseobacterium sp.]
MKKILALLLLTIIFSCGTKTISPKTVTKVPAQKANPVAINQTETEYEQLIKTYKPETAKVLEDLLNGSEGNPNTSISLENKSACNMVLTISGPNYFKKIPIPAGKIGSVMVPKNQNYNLSGMVCRSVYQKTKFVSSSYSVAVSN